jgi:hypothetical protein
LAGDELQRRFDRGQPGTRRQQGLQGGREDEQRAEHQQQATRVERGAGTAAAREQNGHVERQRQQGNGKRTIDRRRPAQPEGEGRRAREQRHLDRAYSARERRCER